MYLKNILFLFFLAISIKLHAQNASIEGEVIEANTQSPLEFSNISVRNSIDSSLVTGVLADGNGRFKISSLQAGNFYLEVKFLGYDSKIISNLIVTDNKKLNIGKVALSPNQRFLNEVKVTGTANQSFNKIDKQVYKSDQFAAAKGGTAVDVLKNLPSVAVNGQGEITLRGSSGFLVLINGKPIQGDAQSVLSQLPANTLQNIELITAPSAKYDADGKGGILNITTKKGADNGIAFIANIQGGLPSVDDYNNKDKQQRYGADFTVNYRSNKWDISASTNFLRNDNAGFREGDVFTINNVIKTTFPSNGERSFDKYNFGGRFNIGFNPDKNNSFSVGFFSGYKFQDRLADIYYNNTKINSNGNIIGRKQYFNSNLQNKQADFVLGNFDYSHNFKDQSSLSFSVLYEYDNLYGATRNRNIEAISDTVQNTINTYNNPLNGFRGKIDYSKKVGTGKLELGYQYRTDKQDGNFVYQQSDFGTPFKIIPQFTGAVNSVNKIHGLYTQFSGKIKNLEYIAGLRYENAQRDLNVSTISRDFKLRYNNLFPSASVLYSLKNDFKLKAGVSRRVQRNNNFELNPIQEREHSETLEQGDPNLLPEFIYLVEMGIIKTLNKGSVFATLYFQDIKNPIQRVNSVFADTILNRIFTNAGTAQRYGAEMGLNLQPAKFWSIYLGANVYNFNLKGSILNNSVNVNNNGFVYSLNTNTNINISKSWIVQGNLNYLSNRPTAQGEDSRFLSPNLSLKKSLLDGRLTALLQWQNIDLGFNESNRQRITTSGTNFYTTTNYIYETNVFMLNFSFNLNKLSSKLKLPGSEFGEKEF